MFQLLHVAAGRNVTEYYGKIGLRVGGSLEIRFLLRFKVYSNHIHKLRIIAENLQCRLYAGISGILRTKTKLQRVMTVRQKLAKYVLAEQHHISGNAKERTTGTC